MDSNPIRESLLQVAIITGPTASGKTDWAIALAKAARTNIEIINADSLLLYKGLSIGVAKPSASDLAAIPHHVIDLYDPDQNISAGQYAKFAEEACNEVVSRGNIPLIVGGSGFYIKALTTPMWSDFPANPELRADLAQLTSEDLYHKLESHDPLAAKKIGIGDRYRLSRALENLLDPRTVEGPKEPRIAGKIFKVDRNNEDLNFRIAARTKKMIAQGILEETKWLLEKYPTSRALSAVGYAQCKAHLENVLPQGRKVRSGLEGLEDEINLATRQLVKSQRTYFKSQLEGETYLLDQDLDKLTQDVKSLVS